MPLKTELQRVTMEISRKANFSYTFTEWNDTALTQPANYTGYTGEMRVWRHPYENKPVFVINQANGLIASASPAGGGSWAVDIPFARVAASLEEGVAYEFRFSAASGLNSKELVRGTITGRA